jgi:hypothetical protein
MLYYLRDHDDAIRLATTFTVLLPLGGAIGITPVGELHVSVTRSSMPHESIGVLLDRGGIFSASLVILFMGILFGIFGIIRSYSAQLMSIYMLVFIRPLMYTFGKTFSSTADSDTDHILIVGDYCAKFEHSSSSCLLI